jgi:GxxExxY protein
MGRDQMNIEEIGKEIVDSAIKVHKALGPGLLESAYQRCMEVELSKRGLQVECEKPMPIRYDGQLIDVGYRIDMLVEGKVIIENKTVEGLQPIHYAQIITYLKLAECKLGYLLNWNVTRIKDGIKRVVNGLEE